MNELVTPSLSYHEALLERTGRAHIVDCPHVYAPDTERIEALNRGEQVSETEALAAYFGRLETGDSEYMRQIDRIVAARQQQFPDAVASMASRQLQFVVPAYREGENITPLLENLKRQFDTTGLGRWGVTVALNHAVPYANPSEASAMKRMTDQIEKFLEDHPDLRPYVDYFSFTRRKDTATPALPVGLARKAGEDVILRERLQGDDSHKKPLYLGLMDCDLDSMSDGVVQEILDQLPDDEHDTPKIVRVRGSFDRNALAKNPELHPLEMMWEGMTSEVATNTRHNPFTVGRMSVVPARELAITGGAFAKQLAFPDEDIRHGMQIAWQLDNVAVAEVVGRYSTSPRREIDTVRSLLAMLKDNGGKFTMETLEYASLIRMYGNFANKDFREEFGNGFDQDATLWNPLEDPEQFKQIVPSELIEVSANARYRFGLFSKFVVEALSVDPHTPEIGELRKRFLAGEMPGFIAEFEAVDLIRRISFEDPERFARLSPALAWADGMARQSMEHILQENGIRYEIEEPETPIYVLEADMLGEKTKERDDTPLRAVFRIPPDQPEYMAHIRHEIKQGS